MRFYPTKTSVHKGSKCYLSYYMCICILQVQDIVDDYKNANLTISKNCKKISEMLLVKIDGKRVYDNLEFEEEQVNHEKILDMIRGLLSSLSLWVF